MTVSCQSVCVLCMGAIFSMIARTRPHGKGGGGWAAGAAAHRLLVFHPSRQLAQLLFQSLLALHQLSVAFQHSFLGSGKQQIPERRASVKWANTQCCLAAGQTESGEHGGLIHCVGIDSATQGRTVLQNQVDALIVAAKTALLATTAHSHPPPPDTHCGLHTRHVCFRTSNASTLEATSMNTFTMAVRARVPWRNTSAWRRGKKSYHLEAPQIVRVYVREGKWGRGSAL